MDIQGLRHSLERRKGQKEEILINIQEVERKIEGYKRKKDVFEKAREVLNGLMEQLQQKLQSNISDLGTLAMESVLQDPYRLVIEFVRRRNKMECDIYFLNEEDKRIEPKYAGGGAMDIASFALRVASWSMFKPQLRNVIILDEPLKHLKGQEGNLNALKMIKELSEKQNLQVIMISDERADRELTMEVADRLFEVSQEKGISKIEIIK